MSKFNIRRKYRNKHILIMFIFFIPVVIFAQDAHYWNLTYGTTSTLLGGSVVGSVSDLSATFYNPGMLGLKRNAELVVGARVFELSNLSVSSSSMDNYELSSTAFRPSPSFMGGTFMTDSSKLNRITYSYLTRQYFDFNLEGRYVLSADDANIDSEIILTKNVSEYWGGVTWSRRISDHIGLGITQFFALRNSEKRMTVKKNELSDYNEISNYNYTVFYDFYNVRTLWKLGLGFDFSFASLGLTITTPSINLFGSGESYFSEIVNDFVSVANANSFSANTQKGLSSTYRNSWAVAVGGAYRLDRSRIHFSAEWYNALTNYNVLDMETFISKSQNEVIDYTLKHEARSIINYGFGYEFKFIENISGYASFSTDYSTTVPNSDANLSEAKWNIYHLITGASFTFFRTEITAGFEYAFGNKKGDNLFNNSNEVDNYIKNFNGESEVKYNRSKFILVFKYEF